MNSHVFNQDPLPVQRNIACTGSFLVFDDGESLHSDNNPVKSLSYSVITV